ncbi:MAG: Na+/H+ antiporter NhaA [Verrucomicrobiae bacterium]|nr:Na+/H+ antiporter NhaA [Verrucomicrobiae bacterium]
MTSALQRILPKEALPGLLLMASMVFALVAANSGLSGWYEQLLAVKAQISVGDFAIAKPILLWINDGFMAVFFFLVGLELKRELMAGELSDRKKVVLPLAAAIGGIVLPAVIYAIINRNDPAALKGWAIPAATDIAFALGVLALLGSRVPLTLKIFLASIAVIDDLAAIIIIAVFYTSELSVGSLLLALLFLSWLLVLNRMGITAKTPYILLSIALWVAVLKSGVHATLAGVAVAAFIPYRPVKGAAEGSETLVEELEHQIQPWVAYGILPVFAFANAGVPLGDLTFAALLEPVPLGIALGLFLGKQLGVFGASWLAVKTGIARLPEGANWRHVYGVALLCGIGFTMSLFIGSLAFEQGGATGDAFQDRLGILMGSLLSAIGGVVVLRFFSTNGQRQETDSSVPAPQD